MRTKKSFQGGNHVIVDVINSFTKEFIPKRDAKAYARAGTFGEVVELGIAIDRECYCWIVELDQYATGSIPVEQKLCLQQENNPMAYLKTKLYKVYTLGLVLLC